MRFLTYVLLILSGLNGFAASESTTVVVDGMTCVSCARSVERSLKTFSEVDAVKISLSTRKVTVIYKEGKRLSPDQIRIAIKEAGYSVKSVEGSKPK